MYVSDYMDGSEEYHDTAKESGIAMVKENVMLKNKYKEPEKPNREEIMRGWADTESGGYSYYQTAMQDYNANLREWQSEQEKVFTIDKNGNRIVRRYMLDVCREIDVRIWKGLL